MHNFEAAVPLFDIEPALHATIAVFLVFLIGFSITTFL